MKYYLSETGVIQGRGTQPWKYVSHLSDEERAAVKDGSGIVLIRDYQAFHYTQSGYKQVFFMSGRYVHREPHPDILRAFNSYLNKKGG